MKFRYTCLGLLLLSLSLVACEKVPENDTVNVSSVSSVVKIHTDKQLEIINHANPDEFMGNQSTIYGLRSWSKPNGVHVTWNEDNVEGVSASTYKVYLADNPSFTDPVIYQTDKQEVDFYNLKLTGTYYYKVIAEYSKASFESEVKHFTVEDVAPRNIHIDGLENVRDLGGWNIGEGKIYKQGLIYRSVQFNYGGINSYKRSPTEYGLWQIKNELKIHTDIDLRKTKSFCGEDEVNGITSSPLGNDVKYVSAPMKYDGVNPFTNAINKNSMQLVFNTLADASNYPVVFHCLRGTDRTGAIAYMLGALVGMSEKDLMLDYLFSDLANINGMVRASTISGEDFYVQGIANSEGDTLSIKAMNYLHNTCDVPLATIEQVIGNLTANI